VKKIIVSQVNPTPKKEQKGNICNRNRGWISNPELAKTSMKKRKRRKEADTACQGHNECHL
jgi:hypothetical protein